MSEFSYKQHFMMSRKTILCIREKVEICRFRDCNPNKSQQSIASHFSSLWNKPISRRCVGDILVSKEKWLLEHSESKKIKSAEHDNLEQTLFIWFAQTKAKNGPVTDEFLKAKAKEFGKKLGITYFSYSNGWLHRFKQRYEISLARQGKAADGKEGGTDKTLENFGDLISKYNQRDIYNMDESALFFRMLPNKSPNNKLDCESDKTKGRITLVFCVNADGSDRRKLTLLGKRAKPRSFKNFDPNHFVRYRNNKKAWMTSVAFHDWVLELNVDMKKENRHILLLVDNAPCHAKLDLSNVKIEFLPLGCTGILQPCQSGVIKFFKAHYRCSQVQHIIREEQPTLLTLKDAVYLIKRAWDSITAETVVNCWKDAGLIARDTREITSFSLPIEVMHAVQMLSECLNYLSVKMGPCVTAEELVSVDSKESVCEEMSDDDIISYCVTQEIEEDSDSETEAESVVTASEAEECVRKLKLFFKKNGGYKEEMIRILAIESRLEQLQSKKQKKNRQAVSGSKDSIEIGQ